MNMQHDSHCKRYFSWKAVFVGAVVAFGLLFLFNLLTLGGGLSSYTRTEKGLEVLVALAYLWTLLGSFVMLFIAGLVTSMVVSHDHCTNEPYHGILHGFITWVLYILISVTFLTHVSEASIVTFPQNFLNVSKETLNADTDNATAAANNAVSSSATTSNTNEENRANQKEAHKLGIATLATFFIFLVEAIGACFGAWCGMDLRRRYLPKDSTAPSKRFD